ncbi:MULTISPECIES: FecR family protein [Porphyromonadaceae]|uniref:Uncharacterized protein n=1 Tax=Sanguibacteroides justesenii TaxID=1547597 RepID=A0A0C3RG99_9PORP|nr:MULTISPECIES: FecR family protein [Porphyromonadaceae]KIO43792.1 hypothetical protein IE90_11845 [Sanguibacteroides justesenii]KIO45956.1 hypothetical protein BA92_05800 [Sanguibacteroides justesenii]PXZ44963.1 FecR family protein [Sanguibacteroides justesenii]
MGDEFQRIVFLFRKAFSGKLTVKEREEFDKLMENPFLYRVFTDISDDVYVEEELAKYRLYSPEKAFRKFEQRQIKRLMLRKRLLRCSVAATVFILLGIGTGLWLNRQEEKQLRYAENTVIRPGIAKAYLKLGEKRANEIVLDKEGKIEERGGTKIQYEAGKLTYVSLDTITDAIEYDELIVPAGAECYVALEDGSCIWINAESKLKYPVRFGEGKREIYIEGEAYFDIKKDKRPFIVHSKLGDVRVLGTAFGITAYPEEKMMTTLVRGKVAYIGYGDSLAIEPGEQVMASPTGEVACRKVNVDEYVGWKDGLYVFKDQKLEDIMKTLQRWYDVTVFYQSHHLKEVRFTGNLKRYDTINSFLQLLEGTGELKYRISGNTVILYQ